MAKMSVKYTADSLQDLASGIRDMAATKRALAATARTRTQERDHLGEARGLEYAADIVENTTVTGWEFVERFLGNGWKIADDGDPYKED